MKGFLPMLSKEQHHELFRKYAEAVVEENSTHEPAMRSGEGAIDV